MDSDQESGADLPKPFSSNLALLLAWQISSLDIESYIAAKEAAIMQQSDAIADLRAERRAISIVLENAPFAMLRVDNQFCLLECNDEFLKVIDRRREDVVGQSIFQAAPSLAESAFHEVLKHGVSYRGNAELLSFDGTSSVQYWDWASWPVKNGEGEVLGLVAIFTNATGRVVLQQQREDFVATLTHDLKTPILAASRTIKLLMDGDFGPVSTAQLRVLENLFLSNDAMYKMVLTLLEVYKYDSGTKRLNRRPYDLGAALSRLVTELQPLADAKSIVLETVSLENAGKVECDLDEIRRVVQNLIENSLKFTASGGLVRVTLEQGDSGSIIRVSDTGRGISEDEKPKLFQRFWQSAGGRSHSGSGLGLYLCRQIVEAHGGKIWCDSELGQGSTFSFSMEKRPVLQQENN